MVVIEGINYIGVNVSNLDASVKFYRDLFDFDVVDKYSVPGITFMKVADMILGLYESAGYSASDTAKSPLAFFVDEEDFEDALDELEERGIDIVSGPENLRGGKKVVFCDPDGNKIELSYPKLV